MRIIFISNYLTHHQVPLCEELYQKTDGQFQFIETEAMDDERMKMGWELREKYSFLYRNTDLADLQGLVDSCEVLIIGSIVEHLSLKTRCKKNMITFIYSERRAKRNDLQLISPRARKLVHQVYGKYQFDNFYLLCAGAFVRKDYNFLGAFYGKCLRWGYFPRTVYYPDFTAMMADKMNNSILWTGRMIDFKHPEAAIIVAERLKQNGIYFTMNIIGNGVLEEQMQQMIVEKKLSEQVFLLGAKTPDDVRKYMEQSEIFLFTSDRNEGWGAVLNEAMNSGCAVAACSIIGAVPYLIQDGENGFVFDEKNWDQLFEMVRKMLTEQSLKKRIGENAYRTIQREWNADTASDRLLQIINDLSNNLDPRARYSEGVCSQDKFRLFG